MKLSTVMTIRVCRVSRDGTRTSGPTHVFDSVKDDLPPLMSHSWPPCGCPACRIQGVATEQQMQLEISRMAPGPILRGSAC